MMGVSVYIMSVRQTVMGKMAQTASKFLQVKPVGNWTSSFKKALIADFKVIKSIFISLEYLDLQSLPPHLDNNHSHIRSSNPPIVELKSSDRNTVYHLVKANACHEDALATFSISLFP